MKNALNICMVSYSFYEMDNRVRRYAETLAKLGNQVDVISLRKEGGGFTEIINGVQVFRIQKRLLNEKGKISYLLKILYFFIKSFILISALYIKKRYKIIHIHNVPDFLVFTAIIQKLCGAKIILDIHDILPEFYASKFSKNEKSTIIKSLKWIENISVKFSDHVIISNHLWGEKLVQRSAPNTKITVIMNYPDSTYFYPRNVKKMDGKIILTYPGTLNHHQGLDVAIQALSLIKDKAQHVEFIIYGEGEDRLTLEAMVSELGLEKQVLFKGRLPLDILADEVSKADIGIVPKRDDNFGGEAFSTKTLEFMAMGIPVIVSATKIDRFYFSDSVVRFFKPDDANDLSTAMKQLIESADERKRLSENAAEFVKEMSWEVRKKEYLDIVESLAS